MVAPGDIVRYRPEPATPSHPNRQECKALILSIATTLREVRLTILVRGDTYWEEERCWLNDVKPTKEKAKKLMLDETEFFFWEGCLLNADTVSSRKETLAFFRKLGKLLEYDVE